VATLEALLRKMELAASRVLQRVSLPKNEVNRIDRKAKVNCN
jgi:hypothetical protein